MLLGPLRDAVEGRLQHSFKVGGSWAGLSINEVLALLVKRVVQKAELHELEAELIVAGSTLRRLELHLD